MCNPSLIGQIAADAIVSTGVGTVFGYFSQRGQPKPIPARNYGIWFCCTQLLGNQFQYVGSQLHQFLISPQKNEDSDKQTSTFSSKVNSLKSFYCRSIDKLDHTLELIDQKASSILGIRPQKEINKENVLSASYLEICRYRCTRLFRVIIVSTLFSRISHRLLTKAGLELPQSTILRLPLIFDIVSEILIMPVFSITYRWAKHDLEELKTNPLVSPEDIRYHESLLNLLEKLIRMIT